ncbi:MPN146 family protein [Mycoplasmoides pneumoniae]|uniref:MPN146 family protein n=1 Tax=Mycoplasmoides pneumoniae TaxID=2104 RepID=UPI000A2A2F1B|nr:family K-like protein [Mycoplasmoides pneumoniae]ARQ37848.1 family K-like protein [Mycoplasmoides pneumoniae]
MTIKKVKVIEKASVERMIEVLSDSEILSYLLSNKYTADGVNEIYVTMNIKDKDSNTQRKPDKMSLELELFLNQFIEFLKEQRKS